MKSKILCISYTKILTTVNNIWINLASYILPEIAEDYINEIQNNVI